MELRKDYLQSSWTGRGPSNFNDFVTAEQDSAVQSWAVGLRQFMKLKVDLLILSGYLKAGKFPSACGVLAIRHLPWLPRFPGDLQYPVQVCGAG